MDFILIYIFIVGLFFGSFYNVVALRMPNNESIVYPGSHCVNCRHKLAWYELIPVFSFIFLKGKCKVCKRKISIQYPLAELLTALLFAGSYLKYGISYETLISIVISSIVIITILSDIKYMVILDEVLIVGFVFLAILFVLSGSWSFLFHGILSGLFLFGIMFIVKFLGDKAFKQESLGWGDIKLSAIAGMVLGFKLGVVYIFMGAIIALPYAVFTSIKKKTNIIPFGPFLALSLLILYTNSTIFLGLLNTLIGG